MSAAPTPRQIYDRAVDEGQRRLDQSFVELVATGFIAGFTILFGVVAQGIVRGLFEPVPGPVGHIAGALAFAVGLVLLVVGRAELFTENFFDPVARAVEEPDGWLVGPLLRLWAVTLACNLLGGIALALILAIEGAVPAGTSAALASMAEETAHRDWIARFANAVLGGALVATMSHVLVAVESDGGRIAMAYAVGFLLALGTFDHVVVTVLHVLVGVLAGADVTAGGVVGIAVVATAGNLVGGLGLVTMTHVAQARGL